MTTLERVTSYNFLFYEHFLVVWACSIPNLNLILWWEIGYVYKLLSLNPLAMCTLCEMIWGMCGWVGEGFGSLGKEDWVHV